MTEVQALSAVISTEPEIAPVPYYFATKNGWYSNVPTLYGTAHIPSDKWPKSLPELETRFHFNDEKVPGFIFDQALDFFRKVYAAHKTEATTYICRDADGQYSLFIPTQYVSGASVNHKVEAGQMGERTAVGTIHSHCNFSAFHSGTDEHDMGKMPGLHATIGMVESEEPEYAVAIAVGDNRFDIGPEDIVDDDIDVDANGFNTAPDHWMKFIHPNQQAPWQGGISTKYGKAKTTRFSGYQFGKMHRTGFQRPSWLDDEGWMYHSAFEPSGYQSMGRYSTEEAMVEGHVENSKRFIEEEQHDLAQMGYVLTFELEYDPALAKDFLEAEQAKNADDTLPMFGGRSDAS